MIDFFFNCKTEFPEICEAVLKYAKTEEAKWVPIFGIDVCRIERDFFKQFNKLDALISNFNCVRYSVFRFHPNTCYGWHIDNPGRTCALNMLLGGTDSHTFCGVPALLKENDDYVSIKEIAYEANKFVLIDVRKPHTVFNKNNVRYVLTISFQEKNGEFGKIKDYLINNSF